MRAPPSSLAGARARVRAARGARHLAAISHITRPSMRADRRTDSKSSFASAVCRARITDELAAAARYRRECMHAFYGSHFDSPPNSHTHMHISRFAIPLDTTQRDRSPRVHSGCTRARPYKARGHFRPRFARRPPSICLCVCVSPSLRRERASTR